MYRDLGQFRKALKYHQLDLDIAKEVGDEAGEGSAYSSIGIAHSSLGDFKRAIEYQQLNLEIAKKVGDRAAEGGAYCNIGVVYDSLGDFKRALEYHKKHLKIAEEVGDRAGEGIAYSNLGNAYKISGDLEKAIESHQLHLCIAKEVGDIAGEGGANANLGIVKNCLGKFGEAIKHHEEHLNIAKKVGDRAGEGIAYATLGNAYQSLGNFEKAMDYHQLDLRIAKEVGDIAGEGRAHCSLGKVLEALGDFPEAVKHYQSSVSLYEIIRHGLGSKDKWKINLRNHYQAPYTSLWTVLLKQNKTSEALLAAERGRGQALMDLMKSQYDLTTAGPGSVEQIGQISDLLSYISSPTVFIALDKNAVNFWVLQEGKDCIFLNKEVDPKYFKEDAMASVVSLNEDAYSKIGVLGSVQCENRSFDEPIDDTMPSQMFDRKISEPEDYDDNPLKLLYNLLISPIENLISGGDITFVPDGPLLLAPFAAFMDQNSTYLSEKATIRMIPTLTTLKVMAEFEFSDGHESKTGALLVGDPWVGRVRIKGKAPDQLPNAKKEVEKIGEILKTVPLTGKKATKAEVLSRLRSASLVHIAAHGKAETGEILLSPNPGPYRKPKEKDYLLTMDDVKNAKLNARLVVLSCCHSGRGEINYKAEGVVGIARAFLGAGARSVLASLWAIDDAATLKFMENFYKELVEVKQSASKSLNQAMKVMRESKTFKDVRLWAPFVLIGDDVSLDLGKTL